ncbi:MAG: TRAP transporter permease [Candidatus Rokubacteria bacterium]|nr:TRAP transporter permease [Candidatus Rokubacteria bacterium]
MRKLSGARGLIVGVVAAVMAAYHVYARLTPYAADQQAGLYITLGFSLVLAFFLYPSRPGATPEHVPWTDLGLAALSLGCVGYMFVFYDYVVNRFPTAHPLSPADKLVAVLGILLVLEATRRSIGAALPIVAICFIAYAALGPWLPGALHYRGLTLEILLDQTWFTTEGVFGVPLGVAGSYVILFIVFGAYLEKSGAGQFFMRFANAIAGGSRGGPGKVSVVSSSMFGTISGSAVANVMVDGWLTIPMMKRTGFKPEAAAAIEAVASTGGQIVPPVMGAAAFVMAEFLGWSYGKLMIAAAIPALFYYGALFAAIHFNAVRSGLRGIPREELPRLGEVIRSEGHLILPLLVIFGLLLEGFTATYAAILSSVVVLYCWLLEHRAWPVVAAGAVIWVTTDGRLAGALLAAVALVGLALAAARPGGPARIRRLVLEEIPIGLRDGAQHTVPVAMACAAAGVVIGIVLQTGLALRFTSFLVDLAGQHLILALVITMIAGIVLGMGMPTTPAYIMQAALLIPAIIKLGVPPIAAHMFAFYFSCLSAVTPPVALAVYAAASIGRANLWGAGVQAVKFAAAGFIVPYFFVYSPALLFQGTWADTVTVLVTGTIGVISLAAGLEGQFLRPARWFERVLFIAAALSLIDSSIRTDLVGLALLLVGLGLQKMRPAVIAPGLPVPAPAEPGTPRL